MATASSGMSTSFEINKIPSEPHPLPDMDLLDGEMSFEVLGTSLIMEAEAHLREEPIQSGPIEAAKLLIKKELSMLDEVPDIPASYQVDNDKNININGTISMHTFSSELSPDEIQSKVELLIDENVKLKDTLAQNNVAMKSQYDQIHAWQADVQKTYQAHKIKFAEARNYIAKLKADNACLTFEMEKMKGVKMQQDEEISKLKESLESLNVESKIESSYITVNNLASGPLGVDEVDEQGIVRMVKSAVKKEVCKDCPEYLKQIEILKQEILGREAAKLNDATGPVVKEICKNCPEYLKQIEVMKQEILVKEATISQLKEDIEKQKIVFIDNEKNLNVKIVDLKSQLCMMDTNGEELSIAKKQLMSFQMSVTELNEKIGILEEQLLNADRSKVQELGKLQQVKDDFSALHQQMEVYKTDYEDEKTARLSLKSERDQIAQDYAQIQRRNNELHAEIELLRERFNGFEVIGRPSSGSSCTPHSPPPTAPPGNNTYDCPVCNFRFTELTPLQNHVERCLDMHSAMP